VHHVLHSLAIAKLVRFSPGSKILDAGTGGGFPGIPLAILMPEVHFHLVDSIGKKISVVREIARALQLENVSATISRAEARDEQVDFVVSRAVAPMKSIWEWTHSMIGPKMRNALANGIICLKGGDLDQEIAESGREAMVYNLSDYFVEDFFQTKKIVYLPV
jgi:16S rRNA (guanine527-N7)-methyltransferase